MTETIRMGFIYVVYLSQYNYSGGEFPGDLVVMQKQTSTIRLRCVGELEGCFPKTYSTDFKATEWGTIIK